MARFWIAVCFLLTSLNAVAHARASAEQRKYRTAYACEGSTLTLTCDNAGEVINLLRANYGRFSITICNEHGDTDWSVNCMSHRSLRALHSKCNQQTNCSILASTNVFGDPCPGTLKYLEAHYQCVPATQTSSTSRPRPPWFSSVGPSIWNTAGLQNKTTPTTPTSTTSESTIIQATTASTTTAASSAVNATTTSEAPAPTSTTSATTTTSTTTTTPLPSLLDQLSEVTVLVPDFPGRSKKKPSTPLPSVVDVDDVELVQATTPTTTPAVTTPRRAAPPGSKSAGNAASDSEVPPSDDHSYCQPAVTRGLYWNWTRAGDPVVQPCPGGATGYARWYCIAGGERPHPLAPAAWFPASPDLSECKSVWLTSLDSRIGEGDSIISIANDLAQVTNSKTLYGGDLIAAARLLRQMALKMSSDLQAFPDPRQREAIVTELVQSVVRAGSSLLGSAQSLAWRDLGLTVAQELGSSSSSSSASSGGGSSLSGHRDQHARTTATALLTGLEENAFLLANTISRQKSVYQSFDNILMSVRVMETHNVNELSFPSPEELQVWKSVEDVITLPAEALLENSDGGLVRVVLFAYEHMEDILSPYEDTRRYAGSNSGSNSGSHSGGGAMSSPRGDGIVIQGNVTRIVNSRVISASLGKGRHIQLPQPVTIRFQHLRQDNVSNPTCVFWDYTVSAWSDEGCRVLSTNRTHTQCRCDHLTNFAILMDLHSTRLSAANGVALAAITYVGCSVSIICLLLAIVTFTFFRGLQSDRTTIHKNLCVCLLIAELVFLSGINQTGDRILCGVVAGLLHYFFLCAFMWMLLEGFQLYVMLIEVFESDKSRVKWYYLCGYGVPLLIVAVSSVVDPFSYGTAAYCWLRSDNLFVLSFVAPVIVILLANFVFLGLAIYVLFRHQSTTAVMKSKEQSRLTNARSWIGGAFTLVFLLGLTWTFGLLYVNESTVAMAYIFTVLNSFQGLFIFLFHCVSSDKVRWEVRKYLSRNSYVADCLGLPGTSSQSTPTSTATAGGGNGGGNGGNGGGGGKDTQTSFYGSAAAQMNHNDATLPASTYIHQSWSGTGMVVRGGGGDHTCMITTTPLSHPHHHHNSSAHNNSSSCNNNTNSSIRLNNTNNLRASARELHHKANHQMTNSELENGSYKSYGRDSGNGSSEQDDCSPRQQQLLNLSSSSSSNNRPSAQQHPQQQVIQGSMGRRGGNYPHPVPNPALAEGAALDAQLIAQFRENSLPLRMAHHHQLRGSKRSSHRSASPWNHTYMEIDMRARNARKTLAEELEEGIVDPVYEEIERGVALAAATAAGSLPGGLVGPECPCRNHHYAQGSSDMSDEERRQNSDVSRQSSRSYGDNRPLIPLHPAIPAHPHTHDLLTTISCAFNSPHLRTKHRHPHDAPEATPIHMGFDGAPHFDADRYGVAGSAAGSVHYPIYDENGLTAVSLMNGERIFVASGAVLEASSNRSSMMRSSGIPASGSSIPFTEC